MTEQEKNLSMYDIFGATEETLEEAVKKSSEESSKKAKYLRISKDGTYAVRILPLAPVVDPDGEILPMDRKGYEYPLRSLTLKIEDSSKMEKGKPKMVYATVCNAKYAFPNLAADPIDTYVQVACDLYASDTKMCEKLHESSFNGGLKWDSSRCIYVIECENRGAGIQILQLSFAQYKTLEEMKLNLWNKLNKKGAKRPCPISSVRGAYPVEIIRKTEGKTKYTFNIDLTAGENELDEETLQELFNTPRLPEVIYRYSRYHYEATMTFLSQLDERFGIKVMEDERMKNCLEQVKTLLSPDDQSHFTLGGKDSDSASDNDSDSLQALYDRYDQLADQGLDDETEEGQELRGSIRSFIEANDLDITIGRKKTNLMLLDEINDVMYGPEDGEEESEPESKPKAKPAPAPEPETDDDDEPEEPAEDPEPEPEPERPSRRERNDDTNEPAERPRRASRPARRR